MGRKKEKFPFSPPFTVCLGVCVHFNNAGLSLSLSLLLHSEMPLSLIFSLHTHTHTSSLAQTVISIQGKKQHALHVQSVLHYFPAVIRGFLPPFIEKQYLTPLPPLPLVFLPLLLSLIKDQAPTPSLPPLQEKRPTILLVEQGETSHRPNPPYVQHCLSNICTSMVYRTSTHYAYLHCFYSLSPSMPRGQAKPPTREKIKCPSFCGQCRFFYCYNFFLKKILSISSPRFARNDVERSFSI